MYDNRKFIIIIVIIILISFPTIGLVVKTRKLKKRLKFFPIIKHKQYIEESFRYFLLYILKPVLSLQLITSIYPLFRMQIQCIPKIAILNRRSKGLCVFCAHFLLRSDGNCLSRGTILISLDGIRR